MHSDDSDNATVENDQVVQVTDLAPRGATAKRTATQQLLRSPAFLRVATAISIVLLASLVIFSSFPAVRATIWNVITRPAPIPASDIFIARNADTLYALRNTNGSLLWRFQSDGSMLASPVVANNTVYLGTNDGTVDVLRISDGSILWRYKVDSLVSSILVNNNIVYIVERYPGHIFAFQADTGKLLWNYATREDAPLLPVIVNGILYDASSPSEFLNSTTASTPSIVFAIHADTGKELWHHLIPVNPLQQLAVNSNTVFVSSSFPGDIYALRTTTGAQRWLVQLHMQSLSFLTADNGIVFAWTPDGAFTAFRADDGQKVWQQYASVFASTPTDALWFTTNYGNIYILNTGSGNVNDIYSFRESDGAILWHNTTVLLEQAAIAYNGVLYIGSTGGYLSAIREDNGAALWRARIDTAFVSLAVSNGNVIVNAMDNLPTIYAFSMKDGKLQWRYTET